jgi:hypothetical protein
MSASRTRTTPPFTRRGVSYGDTAKRFWKKFRSKSPASEGFKSESRTWRRFNALLCGQNSELLELLLNIFIDQIVQAGTTQGYVVRLAVGTGVGSMPIAFLCPTLQNHSLPHPFRLTGSLASVVDSLATLHPDMWWWISDQGLVMANIEAEDVIVCSGFNQLAGSLFSQEESAGRLSQSALTEISRQLDAAGYQLKENLQPAHWRQIAAHNQKFSRQAIRTFESAAAHPLSTHFVRKRLYVARDAYRKVFLKVR